MVAATGLGKTALMAGLAKHWPHGRVMMLSHRFELNQQAMKEFERVCGEPVDLEQAEYFADQRSRPHRIVVASVQTLNARRHGRERMRRFRPDDFGLVMVDEAHHATAATYRKVFDHFAVNSECRFIGVTATPDRLDGVGMGHVFDAVACDFNLLWGIENGWLVAPQQKFVQVEGLDLSQVRTVGGDLDEKQLARIVEQEKTLHSMAAPIVDVCGQEQQAIVFTASVAQAHRLADIITDYRTRKFGESSGLVVSMDGSWSPQDPRRINVVKRFKSGEIQVLVNCGIACLDSETEILTTDGWVGHAEITAEHEVANWDDGTITFTKPIGIEVRERRIDEEMVCLETERRSVRVTAEHRMLFRTGQQGKFHVRLAGDIVGVKGQVPICGNAEPFDIAPEQESHPDLRSRIRANSYVLRKAGMGPQEARDVATRRIVDRLSLRYASPSELTIAECQFIGFWLGDGSHCELGRGGHEYSVSQGVNWPNINRWLEDLFDACGLDYVRHHKGQRDNGRWNTWAGHYQYSFGRGTGFGSQKRRGLYRLEPYLKKDGADLLWGLNADQYLAVIQGFWMADGHHKDSGEPIEDGLRISQTNKRLADHLQAIGTCRGYRVSVSQAKGKNRHGRPIWNMHVSQRESHSLTKYRFERETIWKPETVWCVKVPSGFIVTRRRGTVTVTGNTEGFDAPNVRVVAIGRPTKSRALYQQMLGRGTRPLPGVADGGGTAAERLAMIAASDKPHCTVIDFVGQSGRHKLVCSTDILAGEAPEEVVERAKAIQKRDGFQRTSLDALREAQEELERERQAKRARVTVGVEYKLLDARHPYVKAEVPKVFCPGYLMRKPPSDKQRGLLIRLGYREVEVNAMNPREASAAIDYAIKNPRNSLARFIAQKRREEGRVE